MSPHSIFRRSHLIVTLFYIIPIVYSLECHQSYAGINARFIFLNVNPIRIYFKLAKIMLRAPLRYRIYLQQYSSTGLSGSDAIQSI